MDLLRFLLSLPLRLVRGLLYVIALLLRPLIGNVSWSAPGWVPATGSFVKRKPLHSAGIVLAAVAIAAGGWFGWQWYKNRPRPVEPTRITFEVSKPADRVAVCRIRATDVNHAEVGSREVRIPAGGGTKQLKERLDTSAQATSVHIQYCNLVE